MIMQARFRNHCDICKSFCGSEFRAKSKTGASSSIMTQAIDFCNSFDEFKSCVGSRNYSYSWVNRQC